LTATSLFFSSRRRHTRSDRDWSSDVCSSDLPDLNLSESIQRIPGVALARDAGEGRNITVRGLGPQFTRVRINGMEALTTTGSSRSEERRVGKEGGSRRWTGSKQINDCG